MSIATEVYAEILNDATIAGMRPLVAWMSANRTRLVTMMDAMVPADEGIPLPSTLDDVERVVTLVGRRYPSNNMQGTAAAVRDLFALVAWSPMHVENVGRSLLARAEELDRQGANVTALRVARRLLDAEGARLRSVGAGPYDEVQRAGTSDVDVIAAFDTATPSEVAETAAETVAAVAAERPWITLDTTNGIVLRDTERSQAAVIKGAPMRFQWSHQGFWYVPRTKDKRVSPSIARTLVDYFAANGIDVRTQGPAAPAETATATGPVATGPTLQSVLTSTGHVTSKAWTGDPAVDPFVIKYEASARSVLGLLPAGLRILRRHSSKYGDVYLFLDTADRLLTRADYARLGGKEALAAKVQGERDEAAEAAAVAVQRAADAEADLLERARTWRGPQGQRVYEVDARTFGHAMGIHQPWIAEISGVQYARMSDRSKRAYDEKRHREWGAAADGATLWQSMVQALARAGDITYDTPGLSTEAKSAVFTAERAAPVRPVTPEAAAAAIVHPETYTPTSATTQQQIETIVSRGIKREAGAVAYRNGFARFSGDRTLQLTFAGKVWRVGPARGNQGERVSSSYTDTSDPAAVAAEIFAAFRTLAPPIGGSDYIGYAKKHAKKLFGAQKQKGDEILALMIEPYGRSSDYDTGLDLAVHALADGYAVHADTYIPGHHKTRTPYAEAHGPPAEALAAVHAIMAPRIAAWRDAAARYRALSDKMNALKEAGEPFHDVLMERHEVGKIKERAMGANP